jgi:hypothetical protein
MKPLQQAVMILALALDSLASFAGHCPPVGNADTRPAFDASLLKEGRFVYHTTREGKSLGEMVIEVRRAGDAYRITMNAPQIAQSWQASVRRSFEPLSAQLKMQARGMPYSMTLTYDGTAIKGEERKGEIVTPVSGNASGVVIDQRVDWASMMALKASAGGAITVSVFDPSTGFSALLGKVSEAGAELRIDYSICKREHLENYTVYATRATPRYMLREDMPNGLVTRLVRIEP